MPITTNYDTRHIFASAVNKEDTLDITNTNVAWASNVMLKTNADGNNPKIMARYTRTGKWGYSWLRVFVISW